VKICQPAEGCHVDGDICHTTSDCCGAAGTGLPGDGNVTCLKANSTDPVGICRNPMSCDPEGDVCHFQAYQCGNSDARANCCGGLGAQSGVCKLDVLGVPRCYGLGTMCRQMGQTCSNSLDCCNGVPCVSNGMGELVCAQTMCIAMNGSCTQSADCCNGATCVFTAGQTYGTCGGAGTCELAGQPCSASQPCCTNPPSGTCNDQMTGMPCGATETTGCVCEQILF
jgi:hypothetical protein